MSDIKHGRCFLEIQDEPELQALTCRPHCFPSQKYSSSRRLQSPSGLHSPIPTPVTRLMAIKWRCAKWPALHSDDGEQTISERTEGSFTHKAHLNWKKKFLHFEMFKTVAWGTPLSDVVQDYLP